jgi:hypothetical protein
MLLGGSCCDITVMLCHFARPASVDYRLQHFRQEMGVRKPVFAQKLRPGRQEMGDGRVKDVAEPAEFGRAAARPYHKQKSIRVHP